MKKIMSIVLLLAIFNTQSFDIKALIAPLFFFSLTKGQYQGGHSEQTSISSNSTNSFIPEKFLNTLGYNVTSNVHNPVLSPEDREKINQLQDNDDQSIVLISCQSPHGDIVTTGPVRISHNSKEQKEAYNKLIRLSQNQSDHLKKHGRLNEKTKGHIDRYASIVFTCSNPPAFTTNEAVCKLIKEKGWFLHPLQNEDIR